jgi:putative membrane protein
MILRPKIPWVGLLFAWRGSVLPGLLPRLLIVIALSGIAVTLRGWYPSRQLPLGTPPFSLVGISLAVFLGFRNSTAFERYWEGRKLWGQLVITARSLARQAMTLPAPPTPAGDVAQFTRIIVAFAYALKHKLRRSDPGVELAGEIDLSAMPPGHEPAMLLLRAGQWVVAQRAAGRLDPQCVQAMDANLNRLSEVLGGCERIANTPLPFAYSVMIHRTVYLFCALLPFGLVDSVGLLTPLFAVLVAYTFMALEAIAAEIEDPFGEEPNDLPLSALCVTIDNTLRAMRGETPGEEVRPDGHFVVR